MKITHRVIIALLCNLSLPLCAFSEAPIIDDSENFAIIDGKQGAVNDKPLAHDTLHDTAEEENVALSRDVRRQQTKENIGQVNKLQALEQEVQELRGQLEVQGHELKQLKDQQLAFYKDLDARIQTSRAPSVAVSKSNFAVGEPHASTPQAVVSQATPPAPKVALAVAKGGSEESQYTKAYELINQKQTDAAIVSMSNFVATYPSSAYASNAHYWLGELYMIKNDYPNAITEFNNVINQYPNSNKKASSHLKLGYALLASGQTEEAKQRLREVIKTYPDTQTAQLAALKLQSIHS